MTTEELRLEGNAFFRNEKYFAAYDTYRSAISKCPTENKPLLSILYTNLSASALILEKTNEAIEAASSAIACDPSNFKAFLRRGNAYAESLSWSDAYKDYLEAAKLKPNEKYFRDRLEYAKRKHTAQKYTAAIVGAEEAVKPEPPRMPKSASRPEIAQTVIDAKHLEFNPENIQEMMAKMFKDERPTDATVLSMLKKAREMHQTMPNIVNIDVAKIHVVGDTHGQFQDVIALFEQFGYPSRTNQYLFNGDYVDRGSMGVEIVLTLLAWKLYDPSCIFLNRGNHETNAMNSMYGFSNECTAKYNKEVFEEFSRLFNTLPLGHIVNSRVLVVHGGLFSDPSVTIQTIQKLSRISQPPESGPLNDILWSDPMEQNGYAPSPRGVTRTFGPDVTERFLDNNHLELLIRSHQVQEEGYGVMHNSKCITVFSAPNYVGQMGNKGAIVDLTFNQDGTIASTDFKTFFAQPIPEKYKPMRYASFSLFNL